jgi:signal transduction histidine kinase
MKLSHQINLFLLILLGTFAVILVTVSYLTINRTVLQDHTTVFTRELENIDFNIRQSHEELESAGLIGLASYVAAEKKRLLGMLKGYKFGQTGQLTLLDMEGRAISREGPGTDIPFNEDFLQIVSTAKAGQFRYLHKDLDKKSDHFDFVIFRRASHWNWLLVLTINEAELFASRDYYLKQAIGFSFAAFVLAALFALTISRTLTKRINPIIQCLKKIEQGDLSSRIMNPHSDEIGSIQISINAMIETVAAKTQELEVINRTLQSEIAERKKAEDNLLQANVSLEEANLKLQELDHLKSMFIASMSHELRTPLNSIIGFTGVILEGMTGKLEPKQKDYLGRAYKSSLHLLALISDVIDISKVESGIVEAYPESFFLNEVIDEVLDAAETHRKEKVELKITISADIEMYSDRKRVLQCILNLLSNALKYTPKGSVDLSTKEFGDQVEIRVKDTGIGISESDMEKLSRPFERLDTPMRKTEAGTGLGLYLTKKLATELLDGSLRAESSLGKGSAFYLTLPKILKLKDPGTKHSSMEVSG